MKILQKFHVCLKKFSFGPLLLKLQNKYKKKICLEKGKTTRKLREKMCGVPSWTLHLIQVDFLVGTAAESFRRSAGFVRAASRKTEICYKKDRIREKQGLNGPCRATGLAVTRNQQMNWINQCDHFWPQGPYIRSSKQTICAETQVLNGPRSATWYHLIQQEVRKLEWTDATILAARSFACRTPCITVDFNTIRFEAFSLHHGVVHSWAWYSVYQCFCH